MFPGRHLLMRSAFQNARQISTNTSLASSKRNHYDSLGLTPKATQADIKSAYYDLSKVYHPDKSSSVEDSGKFRDITEAYEVLGNVSSRKMYDRGMHHGTVTSPGKHYAEEEDDPLSKFYKARERRNKVPTPTGRTPIYDFDEWSRNHYGATFRKDQEIKERLKTDRQRAQQDIHDAQIEKILLVIGMFLLFCMVVMNEDYDVVKTSNNNVKDNGKR